MRIVVFGAGAIGRWLGVAAQQAGHTVTWIGRQPVVEALRQGNGKVLFPNGEVWTLPPALAATRVEEIPPGQDAVLLCVKAYDVEAACLELRCSGFLTEHMRVLTFQNGIGSEDLAAAILGEQRVIPATLTVPLTAEGVADVRVQRAGGGVGLALFGHPDARSAALLDEFRTIAMWRTRLYANWQAMKWSKLLLNLVGNAAGAVLECDVPTLLRDPLGSAVEIRALREAEQVMRALSIRAVNLPGAPAAWFAFALRWAPDVAARYLLRRFFTRARGAKQPSLHYDVWHKRGRSEIRFLNGAVVVAGRRIGVSTPVNAVLSELLERMALGETLPLEARRQRLKEALASTSLH
ncbi:MAG: ketopantoate reductase family protein [Thermoflexales bacterium]